MKILSIDQATIKSGYALYEKNKNIEIFELEEYGIINVSKEKESEKKFSAMCQGIKQLILDFKPDHVIFEDVSLQTNPSTLILLARLQGAIIQTLLDYNITYDIYKPSTWRKTLGFNQGRGVKRKELKVQAIDYVKGKFNLDVEEDVCEAICIGMAYIKTNNL